jgi:hypothetical protein
MPQPVLCNRIGFNAGPDLPSFLLQCDPDPDPGSQGTDNADPDPGQTVKSQKVGFFMKIFF